MSAVSCKGRRFPWIHHGAEVPGLHGASRLVLGVALRSSLGEVPDGGPGPVQLIATPGWPRMPRMREVARSVEVGAGCST